MGDSSRPGLVVAIDGPAGAGKSTVAREVARRLDLRYLDTGAMYRAVTWAVLDRGVDPADERGVVQVSDALRLTVRSDPDAPGVEVDGRDVTGELRTARVAESVSLVSVVSEVRRRMVGLQREIIGDGGIVVEGRDIGTTVAPDAEVKVFLTAATAERVQRRGGQLPEAEAAAAFRDVTDRDRIDASRAASPLARATDAVEVDTTRMPVEDVVAKVLGLIRSTAAG